MFPNLEEIRLWEKRFDEQQDHSPNNAEHHDIFDSRATAIFKDGKWQECCIEDVYDSEQDCPVAYIEDFKSVAVGKWQYDEKKGYVGNGWMDDYIGDMDMPPILIDISEHFGTDFSKEMYMSCLAKLEFFSSIDWETGIDEGSFEIVEYLFHI